MAEILLLKYGEMALKGLNRNSFEDVLVRNLKRRIKDLGKVEIRRAQSTLYVVPKEENYDLDECIRRIQKIFGIAMIHRALEVEKDWNVIMEKGGEYVREALEDASTFKVRAKRSDKKFPMGSPEICMEFGGYLLEKYPHLSVDVHEPEITVGVEIRDYGAYIYAAKIPGAGGMPVGSSGKAMLLISGGIDSPVAGYMMAKRGVTLQAVHFQSPPYTGQLALEKVETLANKVSEYSGWIDMHVVNFTEIQEQIRDNCMEEYMTLIMRRFMMRIACLCAKENDCGALITGESVGQVASQTMKALQCTDAVCDLPVFRPCIGMDKQEIINISRKIDTFETSTLPYEDCCTVFTPRHPKTRPHLDAVVAEEAKLPVDELIERAMASRQVIRCKGAR